MNSPNLETVYAWCPICEMICAPDETDSDFIHIGCGAQTEDVHVVGVKTIEKLTRRLDLLDRAGKALRETNKHLEIAVDNWQDNGDFFSGTKLQNPHQHEKCQNIFLSNEVLLAEIEGDE